MTIDELRRAYAARPFQPFVLHLADGREFPVPSPEFMTLPPASRTFVVYVEKAHHVIDLLLVIDLEFKDHLNGKRKRRKAS